MFSIQASIVSASSFNKKKFKKFGKKLQHERRADFDRMGDRLRDIAKDEERRVKELLKQHQEFFAEKPTKKDSSTSIDFFEK